MLEPRHREPAPAELTPEEAIRAILDLPSAHDLETNAVARAMHEIASRAAGCGCQPCPDLAEGCCDDCGHPSCPNGGGA
jgi:hypothetical protein